MTYLKPGRLDAGQKHFISLRAEKRASCTNAKENRRWNITEFK
ncbi:MAG: hypothetical protein JWO80_2093 [Bryobacterales bacterium]|nr:hypothetical protein [Bryobacterales bacterium]